MGSDSVAGVATGVATGVGITSAVVTGAGLTIGAGVADAVGVGVVGAGVAEAEALGVGVGDADASDTGCPTEPTLVAPSRPSRLRPVVTSAPVTMPMVMTNVAPAVASTLAAATPSTWRRR